MSFTRNFCGIIDFENKRSSNSVAIEKMAKKLNFDSLYTAKENSSFDGVMMANLISSSIQTFSFQNNSFWEQVKTKYQISAFALLINSKQLCSELEINSEVVTVEEIILRSYIKWGKACSEKLLGEWCFAIWDENNQELIMANNQTGSATIHYVLKEGVLYFSTLLAGLVGLKEIPLTLDRQKVFTEFCQYNEHEDTTLYNEIKFLPMAHHMSFGRDRKIKQFNYWKIDPYKDLILENDQEYVERFYEMFDRGVKDIMNLPLNWVGTLSGGLDSSSTTYLACEHLKKENKKLDVFSYVQHFKEFDNLHNTKRGGDERPFVEKLDASIENVNVNYIEREPKGFLDFLQGNFDAFGHPPNTIHLWWLEEICKVAKKSGKGNGILAAEGGNMSISYEGRVTHSNLSQYFSDMKTGLKNQINFKDQSKLFLKSAVCSFLDSKNNTSKKRDQYFKTYLNTKSFISDDFIKEVDGKSIMNDFVFERNKSMDSSKRFKVSNFTPFHSRYGIPNEISSKYDMIINNVPRSVEMFEFIASVPNHQFNRLGNQKYLFKRAFGGKLPDEIVFNEKKALQLSDIVHILRSNMEGLREVVFQIKNSVLCQSMLDMKQLEVFLDKLLDVNYFSEKFTYEVFYRSNSLTLAMFLVHLEQNQQLKSLV